MHLLYAPSRLSSISLMRYLRRLGAVIIAVGGIGCATHADRLRLVREDFYTGHLAAARTEVLELKEKPKFKDEDVLTLDEAVIELADGRPDRAEQLLRKVRDRFNHLEQKAVTEQAASLLTDDNAVAYAGEDHEKLLILSFLALSNLMNGGEDAQAYALQLTEKQQQLIEKAGGEEKLPPAERRIALGPYVRAAVQEETYLNPDDVLRARTQVAAWHPEFRDAQADLQRAQHEAPSQPGHGVVYVFTLVGRGPTKEEVAEVPTQVALLIADQIVSAVAKQSLPPTIAPVKVAKVVPRYNRIAAVQVSVDGQTAGTTDTLVDVSRVAELHAAAQYDQVLARAVARRVLKKGAIYAVKEGVGADASPLADIALTVAGIAWEATENADTRCWGLLPDRIQVLRLELPAGVHDIALQPTDSRGPFGLVERTAVEVADGRNTYLLANFPDAQIVGKVLTSRQAAVE